MAFVLMVVGFAFFGLVLYLLLFRTPILFAEEEANPMQWYFTRKKQALWRRLGLFELFLLMVGVGFIAGGFVAAVIAAGSG